MPYKTYRPKKETAFRAVQYRSATKLVQCMFLKIKKETAFRAVQYRSATKLVQCMFLKIKNLCFTFCILSSVIIHYIFRCQLSIINSCIRL